MAVVYSNFFGGAFFGGGFFGAGVESVVDQPSNWQADYWKRKSKKEQDEDTLEERIRLGILPPTLREDADEALRTVVAAKDALDRGRIDDSEQLQIAMQARHEYEQAYKAAFEEAYIAEIVAEHWREDMKRMTRRRKAIMLLLH